MKYLLLALLGLSIQSIAEEVKFQCEHKISSTVHKYPDKDEGTYLLVLDKTAMTLQRYAGTTPYYDEPFTCSISPNTEWYNCIKQTFSSYSKEWVADKYSLNRRDLSVKLFHATAKKAYESTMDYLIHGVWTSYNGQCEIAKPLQF